MRAAFDLVSRRLAARDIETAGLDARLLVQAAADLSHEAFIAEPRRALDAGQLAMLEAYVERRIEGEPVARILGRKEFWGCEFLLGPDTLVPRPDSERLVEAALDHLRKLPGSAAPRIADLGTGTGCLLISILLEDARVTGVGTDISRAALDIAAANAHLNEVDGRATFVWGDWVTPLSGLFDLIVSNPPYIPSDEIAGLARDVALFDPHAALDGGNDGLDAYRLIATGAFDRVKPGGVLVVEHGAGQHDAVADILIDAGFAVDRAQDHLSDLRGLKRVVRAARQH